MAELTWGGFLPLQYRVCQDPVQNRANYHFIAVSVKKPKIVIVLFLQLPYIKSQGKKNEVAPHPAPYDSIQIGKNTE